MLSSTTHTYSIQNKHTSQYINRLPSPIVSYNRRSLLPPTRVLEQTIAATQSHVTFDGAVDLVDYHLYTIEHQLRVNAEHLDILCQEVAWAFFFMVVMNIVENLRGRW